MTIFYVSVYRIDIIRQREVKKVKSANKINHKGLLVVPFRSTPTTCRCRSIDIRALFQSNQSKLWRCWLDRTSDPPPTAPANALSANPFRPITRSPIVRDKKRVESERELKVCLPAFLLHTAVISSNLSIRAAHLCDIPKVEKRGAPC